MDGNDLTVAEMYPAAHRNLAPASLWGPPQRATKGVLHTTESRGGFQPGASYFGHSYWPHLTVSRGQVWQHIPIDRAARAMRNMAGGVETNNAGVVQIEVDWNAADAGNIPADTMAALRDLMRWIEAHSDIPRSSGVQFHPYPPDQRLGQESWRLRGRAWLDYRGWCGHQHVDENDHGDPGDIDITYLLDGAQPPATAPQEADEMTPEQMAELKAHIDSAIARASVQIGHGSDGRCWVTRWGWKRRYIASPDELAVLTKLVGVPWVGEVPDAWLAAHPIDNPAQVAAQVPDGMAEAIAGLLVDPVAKAVVDEEAKRLGNG